MPVSAETLSMLMASGLSGDALIAVVASIDADHATGRRTKSAGAIRQERYRNRQASQNVTSDVTGDVTGAKESSPIPPKEKTTPPSPPKGGSVPPSGGTALDKLLDKLLAAAGIEGFREERNVGLVKLTPILALIEQGYDLDADILPVIRDRAATGFKPGSWGYYTNSVVEAAKAKRAIPPKPLAPVVDWTERIKAFRDNGTWPHSWGPKPDEPGCRAPKELTERDMEGRAA